MSNRSGRNGAPERKGGDALTVKSVHKAFEILEAFEGKSRYLNFVDIVEATGLDKSAVQRFTYTLVQLGYLEQDPATRRYALGRKLLALSFDFLKGFHLIEKASPILLDLRQAVQERVDMSLRSGWSLIYVIRLQQKRETYAQGLIGRRLPLYFSAGGRAILSHLSDEMAEQIISESPRPKLTYATKTDVGKIMQEVRLARERGYALQVEEGRPNEMAMASAILDDKGLPIAAVHVAVAVTDWTASRFEKKVAPLVLRAAKEISE